MRLLRTAGERCRTASADELRVGFVDSVHAIEHELGDSHGLFVLVLLGDVGEPHGLLRLADGVDVRRGRIAENLDGLLGFGGGGGGGGFGHGCVGWCLSAQQ